MVLNIPDILPKLGMVVKFMKIIKTLIIFSSTFWMIFFGGFGYSEDALGNVDIMKTLYKTFWYTMSGCWLSFVAMIVCGFFSKIVFLKFFLVFYILLSVRYWSK